jgi:hypothetical protein
MADMADLVIRFSERGASSVLNQIEQVSTKGSKATAVLKGAAVAGAVFGAAIAGIGYATSQIKDATVKFESLQAGIQTAVGSAEEAQTVFKILQDFAAKTPYDVEQVTTAFTQLVNYGLTPSERALKSYGNTAAAMRKDMSQMVEAVADAVTGEFERLKEFGIKSKVEGDNVKFTFRGVSTSVKNDADAIEGYLIKLGETNFGDAMENQAKTLGGRIDALQSSWENMWYEVGQMGLGDAIGDGVQSATEGIETITGMLASGEIEAYLDIMGAYFGSTFDTVSEGAAAITSWMSDLWAKHGDSVIGVIGYIADAWMSLPMTIRYWVSRATIVVASFVEKMVAYGNVIRQALNPFDDVSIKQSKVNLDTTLAGIKRVDEAQIKATNDQLAANQKQVSTALANARKLTAERLSGNKKVEKAEGDRLAKYSIKAKDKGDIESKDDKKGGGGGKKGGTSGKSAADKAKREADKAAREAERAEERALHEFQRLKESLETGTETAAREQKERNAIIMKSTKEGSAERTELLRRSEEKFADDMNSLRTTGELANLKKSMAKEEDIIKESYEERNRIINRYAPDSEKGGLMDKSKEVYEREQQELRDRREQARQSLMEGLISEESEIIASYDRRRQAILSATELTEEEKADLVKKLGEKHKQNLDVLMIEQIDAVTSNMASSLGVMTDMLSDAGKESNFLYKAMIMAQKAAAIPQILISTEVGAAKALELGPIAGPIASGAIRALGYAAIGTVAGQAIAGLFDQGGMIPSGKVGIVGERGPEFVKGPAIVTSRQQTASQRNSRGGSGTVINVTNNAPVKVHAQESPNGDIEMIIEEASKRVEKKLIAGITTGDGEMSRTMQSTYGLNRGNRK